MIIIPTKGRPQNIERFIEAYKKTGAISPVVLLINNDEKNLYGKIKFPENFSIKEFSSENSAAECVNQYFQENLNHDFYGILADDIIPETEGWDLKLKEACGLEKLAWADDGIQGENLPTHPFFGGNLLRKIGFIAPPGIRHCYVDNFWKLVATVLEKGVYLPEIKLTHHHYLKGAPMDQTYTNQPNHEADRLTFVKFLTGEYQEVRKRLA